MAGYFKVKIRLRTTRNLIFFVWMSVISCRVREPIQITVVWENNRATGISVPVKLIGEYDGEVGKVLHVRVTGDQHPFMLGEYLNQDTTIVFRPLIPLTRGVTYEIQVRGNIIGTIEVSMPYPGDAPELSHIYPSRDTIPENLLKVYLKFSRPMQEGKSLQYLTLVQSNGDTSMGAFLDLQPELWNENHDMLTVWLDPGRIKRGLHPNQMYGQPLVKGVRYTLHVSELWRDTEGTPLENSYNKTFFVSDRDSVSPAPHEWLISKPKANTRDSIYVDFLSGMDFSLIQSALHIVDENEKMVKGTWTVSDDESAAWFKPANDWDEKTYELQIQTRMEDLAGNNLNRPFERHIRHEAEIGSAPEVISLPLTTSRDH